MNAYQSWNPEELDSTLKERYDVSYDHGMHFSMRDRFKVQCKECNVTLHESTTSPPHYIEIHEKGCHGCTQANRG